jgi:hypothetical protein
MHRRCVVCGDQRILSPNALSLKAKILPPKNAEAELRAVAALKRNRSPGFSFHQLSCSPRNQKPR